MSAHDGTEAGATPTAPPTLPPSNPLPPVARYARRIAHDLNNFAAVVRTYSELLLADLPAGTTRDDVTEIHRAADAMIAYLQRVTQFARVSGSRGSAVAVLPLVCDVADEFAEARDRAPVGVSGAASADVVADPEWLRDVVRELIVNAREVAPPSTAIEVRVAEHQKADDTRWVIIEVRDRGPGFPVDIDDTAEDPFVTSKVGVRGAGFGLALAAAFAEASDARLVRSRVVDVTRVALWLPVPDAPTDHFR